MAQEAAVAAVRNFQILSGPTNTMKIIIELTEAAVKTGRKWSFSSDKFSPLKIICSHSTSLSSS